MFEEVILITHLVMVALKRLPKLQYVLSKSYLNWRNVLIGKKSKYVFDLFSTS